MMFTNVETKTLYYMTGKMNKDFSVSWGDQIQLGKGERPSVTINDDNFVLEVHADGNFIQGSFSKIHYRVGIMDSNTLKV